MNNETSNSLAVDWNSLHSLLADQTESAPEHSNPHVDRRSRFFRIRAADSSGERSSASILIDKMYATRGYRATSLPEEATPNLITLVASDHDDTIGTLTIGFDSGDGLLVDDLFPEEVAKLRAEGRKVCEFTKLAMDSVVRSKRVLAALFNVAYIYAHKIKGADNLLIEVNPRHVLYYRAMLGFKVIGPKRLNRRVDAPAVLLSLDLQHCRRQIERLGGQPELSETHRSLYPYSFSPREEAGIVGRLRRTQVEATQVFGFDPAAVMVPFAAGHAAADGGRLRAAANKPLRSSEAARAM